MFSRPRREVVEIPASCLPWISLRGRLLLVGAWGISLSWSDFSLSLHTADYPVPQLLPLPPLFQTCARKRAESRVCASSCGTILRVWAEAGLPHPHLPG